MDLDYIMYENDIKIKEILFDFGCVFYIISIAINTK
jgi:hypothetical protein